MGVSLSPCPPPPASSPCRGVLRFLRPGPGSPLPRPCQCKAMSLGLVMGCMSTVTMGSCPELSITGLGREVVSAFFSLLPQVGNPFPSSHFQGLWLWCPISQVALLVPIPRKAKLPAASMCFWTQSSAGCAFGPLKW